MSEVGNAERELVEKWSTRLKLAADFRDADGRKVAWANMKKYYRNQFDPESVSVNLIFSHGRQMVPNLYFNNPTVECTATRRGWEIKAKILEAVDNTLIVSLHIKDQLKLIIQDGYLYDYGIRKVGYDSEFGFDPEGTLVKNIMGELGVEMGENEAKEFNTFILNESPFFLRVPPTRFLVDPDIEGPGLETAKWVAEIFYRPIEDVLNDVRYDIKDKDALVPSHKMSTEGNQIVVSPVTYKNPGGGLRKYSDVDQIKLYEIWDKRDRKVYIKAEGYPGLLREQSDEWNLRNFFPYDKLSFNPVSDEHFSTSDAMYVEKQQLELNDIRTQEMYHRRKENVKWLAKRGVLSEVEKGKFNSGKPHAFVEIDGAPGTDITSVTGNMTRDIFTAAQDVRNDFREILAFGQNQLAQQMTGRKTASEAMLIDQYVQLRMDERRDIIADYLERTIQDINHLLFKFWDTESVVKIIGQEGEQWQTWTGDLLEGEYAIRVVANSTLPLSKEMYRQKVGELVQVYRNDPYINQVELRRLHLDAYEEFDTSKLLLQQPNQMQVMTPDIRPGKKKWADEEGGGSRIQIPENQDVANVSSQASQTQGEVSNGT
jgi:hypothetical protein